MSVRSLFISTLYFALGIGAVTHAKSQLIEQGPQEVTETEKFADRSSLASSDAFQPPIDESASFGDAPNYWSSWIV